ncbi:MAG: hypothetical protein J0I32_23205 [Sphingobacteriales bacterium]|nr:hypothetical protein [Sphingobacteriales bacterium]
MNTLNTFCFEIAHNKILSGHFAIQQARSGKILLIMAGSSLELTIRQVDQLPFSPFKIKDFSPVLLLQGYGLSQFSSRQPLPGAVRYNFQLKPTGIRQPWDEVPCQTRYFQQRTEALKLARRAAQLFKTEIRLTEGYYPFHASGTYIR